LAGEKPGAGREKVLSRAKLTDIQQLPLASDFSYSTRNFPSYRAIPKPKPKSPTISTAKPPLPPDDCFLGVVPIRAIFQRVVIPFAGLRIQESITNLIYKQRPGRKLKFCFPDKGAFCLQVGKHIFFAEVPSLPQDQIDFDRDSALEKLEALHRAF